MPEALHITRFAPLTAEQSGPLTRFGGAPIGLDPTEWPRSAATNRPLRFVGQLDLRRVPEHLRREEVIYLFFEIYDEQADTYRPDDYRIVRQVSQWNAPEQAREQASGPPAWTIETTTVTEPDWPDMQRLAQQVTQSESRDSAIDRHVEQFGGPKIGGSPVWPDDLFDADPEHWTLLLQLPEHDFSSAAPDNVPLVMDYGDGGTGWLLMSRDGQELKFTWSSS